jgi:acid phosphatase family membrane protein YuiD
MDIVRDLLLNYYFLTFIAAWILSTVIKAFLHSRANAKKFHLKDGFQNGGMPSSHSAVVTSITMALLLKTGFSEYFFISMIFASIVISDAFRVRQNIGLQGEKLNELLKKANQKTIEVVYGHTFLQVIAGIILGILCALFFNFILF